MSSTVDTRVNGSLLSTICRRQELIDAIAEVRGHYSYQCALDAFWKNE
jgi:hypothetical protein